MTVIEGNVNINKIEEVDKIYSKSIYSDFYCRVEGYEQRVKDISTNTFAVAFNKIFNKDNIPKKIGYYSTLLPQKVSIGYSFENIEKPKIILNSKNIVRGRITDEYGETSSYESYIDMVKGFADTFGMIVATQDQDYFDEVFNDTKRTITTLYGKDIKLNKGVSDDYYTLLTVAINNMKVKYFKLNKFKLDTNYLKINQWQPNILRWTWGESEIYLQYLGKLEKLDLDEYHELISKKMGDVVVHTIKVNNNILKKQLISFSKNNVSSLLISEDGFMYLLKMRNTTLSSLESGLKDYMKILYGIYFSNDATDTWYAEAQEKANKYFNKIKELELERKDLQESLNKNVSKIQFLSKSYKKFNTFKKDFGEFPSKKVFDKLSEDVKKLQIEKSNSSIMNNIFN
jgi:hypothetical protein